MKTKKLLLSVPLLALVFSGVSCVSDDWYDSPGNSYYYGQPRGYYYEAPDNRRYDYRQDDYRDRDDRRRSPKGYILAGSFKGGSAIECGIPTQKSIKTVRLVATSGAVSVNTVVLREGSAKTPFTVTRRISAGESVEIDLGGHRQATGLRISTGGKGEFDVFVR